MHIHALYSLPGVLWKPHHATWSRHKRQERYLLQHESITSNAMAFQGIGDGERIDAAEWKRCDAASDCCRQEDEHYYHLVARHLSQRLHGCNRKWRTALCTYSSRKLLFCSSALRAALRALFVAHLLLGRMERGPSVLCLHVDAPCSVRDEPRAAKVFTVVSLCWPLVPRSYYPVDNAPSPLRVYPAAAAVNLDRKTSIVRVPASIFCTRLIAAEENTQGTYLRTNCKVYRHSFYEMYTSSECLGLLLQWQPSACCVGKPVRSISLIAMATSL